MPDLHATTIKRRQSNNRSARESRKRKKTLQIAKDNELAEHRHTVGVQQKLLADQQKTIEKLQRVVDDQQATIRIYEGALDGAGVPNLDLVHAGDSILTELKCFGVEINDMLYTHEYE